MAISALFDSILLGQSSVLTADQHNLYVNSGQLITKQFYDSGAVQRTGAQLISGAKTFANPIVLPSGVNLNTIYPLGSSTAAIHVNNRALAGSWSIFGAGVIGYSINVQGALSSIVPATAGDVASILVDFNSIWSNPFMDETQFSITSEGSTYYFYSDTDANPASSPSFDGNSIVDAHDLASKMASVISTALGVAGTCTDNYDGTITIANNTVGSSSDIGYDFSNWLGGVTGSANGIDEVPETGTREVTLANTDAYHMIYIHNIIAVVDSGGDPWTTADIEIGYTDGFGTFYPVYFINRTNISVGSVLYLGADQIVFMESTALSSAQTGTKMGHSLYARTVNGYNGDAADEETGGAVTILVYGRGA